jgi:hypothetical protein
MQAFKGTHSYLLKGLQKEAAESQWAKPAGLQLPAAAGDFAPAAFKKLVRSEASICRAAAAIKRGDGQVPNRLRITGAMFYCPLRRVRSWLPSGPLTAINPNFGVPIVILPNK